MISACSRLRSGLRLVILVFKREEILIANIVKKDVFPNLVEVGRLPYSPPPNLLLSHNIRAIPKDMELIILFWKPIIQLDFIQT
tara:strand:+ start:250 stop:501 length:252 start_codon:yes stop_codon:yes gene_type:complete